MLGPRPVRQPARMWTPEEDELLRNAMARGPQQTWSMVASQVPGRLGKQCRERWLQHLCPEAPDRPHMLAGERPNPRAL